MSYDVISPLSTREDKGEWCAKMAAIFNIKNIKICKIIALFKLQNVFIDVLVIA